MSVTSSTAGARGSEMIPSFLRRGLLLRLSRAMPPGAYGKRYLSVNSRDAGPRYVSSISHFDMEDESRFSPKSFSPP